MTTSKPMTGEQLDELMTVAVRMQRDAEVDRNFPSANFAYALQVAVLELRRTREISSALAAENSGLKNFISEECLVRNPLSRNQLCAEDVSDALAPETPATDAYLAEVRAQESKRVYESIMDNPSVTDMESLVDLLEQNANDSLAYAAQLRQEAAQ